MLPPTFDQRLRVLRIIWISQLLAILLFAAVAGALTGTQAVAAGSEHAPLRPVLTAVAAGLALLSVWWRRVLGSRTTAGVRAGSPHDALARAFSQVQMHCVTVWALCEGVGVIGLIISLLGGDVTAGVPFFAAAALLMVVNRPSTWRLEAFTRQVPAAGVSR